MHDSIGRGPEAVTVRCEAIRITYLFKCWQLLIQHPETMVMELWFVSFLVLLCLMLYNSRNWTQVSGLQVQYANHLTKGQFIKP